MPELPDLVHLVKVSRTRAARTDRSSRVTVREPIVLRVLVPGASFAAALDGPDVRRQSSATGRSSASRLDGGLELIVHHMLTGRMQLAPAAATSRSRTSASPSTSTTAGASATATSKRMGKVYLVREGEPRGHPRLAGAGHRHPVARPSRARSFERLIAGRRDQVRVFVMDQSALSAIGNAYADEVLFAAGIHPKTPCTRLDAKTGAGGSSTPSAASSPGASTRSSGRAGPWRTRCGTT